MADDNGPQLIGRSYTAGRRQPYMIRKWPGSQWALPLGPYTLTQLIVGVGSVLLLIQTRFLWAHFGALNLVIAIGVPVALTYAARRTRIEGRDPARAALGGLTYLLQPRAGYLRGESWRTAAPTVHRQSICVVADHAPGMEPVSRPRPEHRPPAPPAPPALPAPTAMTLAQLISAAAEQGTRR